MVETTSSASTRSRASVMGITWLWSGVMWRRICSRASSTLIICTWMVWLISLTSTCIEYTGAIIVYA